MTSTIYFLFVMAFATFYHSMRQNGARSRWFPSIYVNLFQSNCIWTRASEWPSCPWLLRFLRARVSHMLNQTFGIHIHFAKWFTRPDSEIDSHAAVEQPRTHRWTALMDECLNALSKRRVSTDSTSIIGSTMWCGGVASSNRRQHFNSDGFVAYLSMLSRRYIWA